MKLLKCKFTTTSTHKSSLNYLLSLPREYDNSNKNWPLILFLHGVGERGENLEIVKKHGIPKIVSEKEDFPFITVSPQCPEDSIWDRELEILYQLIQDIVKNYDIDVSRIYLTGISMGGYGTWCLADKYPSLFAALIPICGVSLPLAKFRSGMPQLKNTPVWVFHGAKDDAVPIHHSEEMVKLLHHVGGKVKFTIYPHLGHDSWTRTYENEEIYDWLLNQLNEEFA
ncbi:prolyl oligopeptidase family serine peptidase [Chengkuizengella axinellae]|uniref:Prolyl oligopeptidase family serine peptidase n=1 Tax=Chengkuizengella axinellae TaxID=3064388 RepID=A0ABT9IZ90_9BACL|nr:prolyl oligopeptidase family serine peptidase [Chengkuizengella sp. 2205SS18-9]MDP5274109.1 prolyl oligopeptidase family serine peptidase [Chengkuizengella sp. 2205SS18-9]